MTASRTLVSVLLGLAAGCVPESGDEPPTPNVVAGRWDLPASPVTCAAPVSGIVRLHDEANQRGLFVPSNGPNPGGPDQLYPPGEGLATMAILGEDMDDDGDIDIVAVNRTPLRLQNDGTGEFHELPEIHAELDGTTLAMAAAELTGDRHIDLVGVRPAFQEGAPSEIVLWRGLGNFEFADPEISSSGLIGRGGEPSSLTLGDVDLDGDLDIFFVARNSTPGTGGSEANRILLNDGFGHFPEHQDLLAFGGWGTVALVATFTDQDGDGDPDLLILGGEPTWGQPPDTPPSAFYRHDGLDQDGLVQYTEVAESVGLGVTFSAMGVDTTDWNGDGLLDYCATDVGPIRCFESMGDSFVESGVQMGLTPEDPVIEWPQTIGWSIDFQDLDNDGWLDILQASGPDHGGVWSGTDRFPDLLFRGLPDGTFDDVTAETGFGSDDMHFGMVSADMDGNGWTDVFLHAEDYGHQPILMMNDCGTEAWVELEFVGAPENRSAIGARVTADLGTRRLLREVGSLRATAMGPTRVHFGLGALETLPALEVRWPDGPVTRLENVPLRGGIVAWHPRAEE
jgi:hypothetical protein